MYVKQLVQLYRLLPIFRIRKRGPVLAILSIAFSIAALLIILSVMQGFRAKFEAKLVGIDGHLHLESTLLPLPFTDLADAPFGEVTDKIKYVSGYIEGRALLSVNEAIQVVDVRGVQADAEFAFLGASLKSLSGTFDLDENGVVLGQGISEAMGLSVGDAVTMINPDGFSESTFTVRGIFETGLFQVDQFVVFISSRNAQVVFNSEDPFTSIKIQLEKSSDLKSVFTALDDALFPNMIVSTWQDQNASLVEALALEQLMMMVILTVMLVLAGFTISVTLSSQVSEQLHTIGVMRAVGISAGMVRILFLSLGIFWYVSGAILGSVLGSAIALNLTSILKGVEWLTGISIFNTQLLFFDDFPIAFNVPVLGFVFGLSLVIAVFSAWLPANRASKTDPIQVLRL